MSDQNWEILDEDNVFAKRYEPWSIECPNPDCDTYVQLYGSVGPSDYSCHLCETRIEVAVRIADKEINQET